MRLDHPTGAFRIISLAIRSLLRVRLRQLDAAGISLKFEQVAEQAERIVEPAPAEPPRPAQIETDLETGAARFTPRTYNEARSIGEYYRAGHDVVVDLGHLGDREAARLVDFSAGMIFVARGSIMRLRDRVFYLEHPNGGPSNPGPGRRVRRPGEPPADGDAAPVPA